MYRHRFFLPLLTLLLFAAPVLAADAPKKLLLVSQGPDGHPARTHEYVAGLKVLEACLKEVKGLEVIGTRADEPWKDGPELIGRADGVVLFLSEGARWMQQDPKRRDALNALAKRGGGVVVLHWAMGTKDAQYIEAFQQIAGGCHGGPDRKYQELEAEGKIVDARQPIASGLKDFRVRDEFYYQLKFVQDDKLKPVLQVPIGGVTETVAWAWERPDGGRSFGFSGLHFHDNWRLREYRRLVTHGVVWTLQLPIPKEGLAVAVTKEELQLK
jgi:type 1 glutamine amidotransferase